MLLLVRMTSIAMSNIRPPVRRSRVSSALEVSGECLRILHPQLVHELLQLHGFLSLVVEDDQVQMLRQ